MRYLYTFEMKDVKSSECGRFFSFDLYSEGNTLEDMIYNAVYIGIDQDGGEGPIREADDLKAELLITKWWHDRIVNVK